MKIGIFQDVHANLPALKKAIDVFEEHSCDKIYHVGDLIGIGPHPKEVVELAFSIPELEFIMGNHDYWFAFGLPNPQPPWMSDEEVEHQLWVHDQIDKKYKEKMREWKFVRKLQITKTQKITFLHYGYDPHTNWFKGFIKEPNRDQLNKLFEDIKADVIFYGHYHEDSDIQGDSRYVNLGSAGCYDKAEVRLGILESNQDELHLKKVVEKYNDGSLMQDFEKRQVPARAFIKNNFITRK